MDIYQSLFNHRNGSPHLFFHGTSGLRLSLTFNIFWTSKFQSSLSLIFLTLVSFQKHRKTSEFLEWRCFSHKTRKSSKNSLLKSGYQVISIYKWHLKRRLLFAFTVKAVGVNKLKTRYLFNVFLVKISNFPLRTFTFFKANSKL